MTTVTRTRTYQYQERLVDAKAVASLAAYKHYYDKPFSKKRFEGDAIIAEVVKAFPDGVIFGVLLSGEPFVKFGADFYELLLNHKISSEPGNY